jgi:hypothetical protein
MFFTDFPPVAAARVRPAVVKCCRLKYLAKMKQLTATTLTLAAIAAGLAANAANAHGDVATDHELLAAYCLGAANAVARQPTGNAQTDTMIERDHQAKLVRLRAYLAAKGYIPTFVRSEATSKSILLFARRGKADEERCRARTAACVPVCTGRPDAGAMTTCMETCRNPEPACPPLARCASDKLPF